MYETLKDRLTNTHYCIVKADSIESVNLVKDLLVEIKRDIECFDRYDMLSGHEKDCLNIIIECIEDAIEIVEKRYKLDF